MKVIANLFLLTIAGSVVLVAAFLTLDFVRSGDAADAARRVSDVAGSVIGEPPVIRRQDPDGEDDNHDVGRGPGTQDQDAAQENAADTGRPGPAGDPDLEEILQTGEQDVEADSVSARRLLSGEQIRPHRADAAADSLPREPSRVSGEALGSVVRSLLEAQRSLEDGK